MGRRDAWNSRLRDRKQLSFSWQKAKEVPKQHSWDAPEQNSPGKRGKEKGKRKCAVSPRLDFGSYYINVMNNTVNFFQVSEKDNFKDNLNSGEFNSKLAYKFG